MSENEIKRIMEMDVDSPKEQVIYEYAWKSAVDPSSVTDGDVIKLREVGLLDGDIVEIQEMIGIGLKFNNFSESLLKGGGNEEGDKK